MSKTALTLKLKDSKLFGKIGDGEWMEIVNAEDALIWASIGWKKDLYNGNELLWEGGHERVSDCECRVKPQFCFVSCREDKTVRIKLIPAKKEPVLVPEDHVFAAASHSKLYAGDNLHPRAEDIEKADNSQREEKTIESDLFSLIESLKESGFVTFTNKSGDIISVKGMLTDIIKRLQPIDPQPLVHKEETQEEMSYWQYQQFAGAAITQLKDENQTLKDEVHRLKSSQNFAISESIQLREENQRLKERLFNNGLLDLDALNKGGVN